MVVLIIILAFILIFLLSTIGFSVCINKDKKIIVNIIIFKVIKIKINEKNKKRKKEKRNFSKPNIPSDVLLKLIKKSIQPVKYLLKKSKLYIFLDLSIGLSAPDKTAITYGLINSLVYTLDGYLKNVSKKLNSSYSIIPNFKEERIDVYLDFKLYIKVFYIFVFLYKILKILIPYRSYFKFKGGVIYGTSN